MIEVFFFNLFVYLIGGFLRVLDDVLDIDDYYCYFYWLIRCYMLIYYLFLVVFRLEFIGVNEYVYVRGLLLIYYVEFNLDILWFILCSFIRICCKLMKIFMGCFKFGNFIKKFD